MRPLSVTSHDALQEGYTYTLTEREGKNFAPDFHPHLTPKEMLELGVFCGTYFDSSVEEFPKEWFVHAKRTEGKPNCKLNFFGVKASQPRSAWLEKGWIYKDDPRGWFQWYCRYYLGRRIPEEDARQIKRWKAFLRHAHQVVQNCRTGDFTCRPVQRQALLHWAYDARKL